MTVALGRLGNAQVWVESVSCFGGRHPYATCNPPCNENIFSSTNLSGCIEIRCLFLVAMLTDLRLDGVVRVVTSAQLVSAGRTPPRKPPHIGAAGSQAINASRRVSSRSMLHPVYLTRTATSPNAGAIDRLLSP